MGGTACKVGVEKKLDDWVKGSLTSRKKDKKGSAKQNQSSAIKCEKRLLVLGPTCAGKSTAVKVVKWSSDEAEAEEKETLAPWTIDCAVRQVRDHLVTIVGFCMQLDAADVRWLRDDSKSPVSDPQHLEVFQQGFYGEINQDLVVGLLRFLAEAVPRHRLLFVDAPASVQLAIDFLPLGLGLLERLQEGRPTRFDKKLLRVRTTGIVEADTVIKEQRVMHESTPFSWRLEPQAIRCIDVGGPRSERRKWLNCFERVNALFLVSATAAICPGRYDDSFDETLGLLTTICKSPFLYSQSRVAVLVSHVDELFACLQASPSARQAAELGFAPQAGSFYLNLLQLLALIFNNVKAAGATNPPLYFYVANLLHDEFPAECLLHFAQQCSNAPDLDAQTTDTRPPATIFRPPAIRDILPPSYVGVFAARSRLTQLCEQQLLKVALDMDVLSALDAALTWHQAPYLKWCFAAARGMPAQQLLDSVAPFLVQVGQSHQQQHEEEEEHKSTTSGCPFAH